MSGRAMDGESQRGLKKEKDVRLSNIMAAKAIADAIRTSLGPRGMDKMIQKGDGEVLITNDGATQGRTRERNSQLQRLISRPFSTRATILSTMEVGHPTAKMLVELSKSQDVEAGDGTTNIMAAKAIADAIRTSLGPRGMDKMIQKGDGEVLITNDGATILSTMEVGHPTAKMLVELSKSQDVCVLAGALLDACHQLLAKGLHPTTIAEAFVRANAECGAILRRVAEPVDLGDRATLVDAVATCLSSKVIAQNSDALAPLAVDAVLGVVDAAAAATVDLDRVKIVKQVGGTVDDTELVDGIVFAQGAKKAAGGPTPGRHERATFPTPTRVANAKIGLIQFCLSAPKTDMENSVVVSDYAAMDRLLREERKHVKKAGVTVLLIQKSILRDAYNDLSLHFLAKMGILVVADVAPRAAFDRRSGRSSLLFNETISDSLSRVFQLQLQLFLFCFLTLDGFRAVGAEAPPAPQVKALAKHALGSLTPLLSLDGFDGKRHAILEAAATPVKHVGLVWCIAS
ncbi:hypothetical protein AURANDRAFT_72615 [Aureococcus anophagefferens]|uniref:T-complex protein 1 subunit delta n=1 Tax=Aureococcus anophagefferens TaxID=44056 RepID=F0YLH2_AURAN|nr:hypothetical protein AURANDRAFT_72615 [Aureococcus anophagefferens]EGB04042.1 hypothetical protein AURANDRAFT_72615 [Aureococcus anophagefferens]|eukprot:XP_009041319.1 hypothetical protein AURANDRAFT_72615 [Aureococcus anophagefferens]